MKKKDRLDNLLFGRGLVKSRSQAKALILRGSVFVDGVMVDKAGKLTAVDVSIEVKEEVKYSSRGGFKLERAIEKFNIDVGGVVAVDIGASTGGFTDCLLKHQALKVYAVDVGYGQLDYVLRNDLRVVVMERRNARYLKPEDIGEPVDLVTVDVSFISLEKILPVSYSLLKPSGKCIVLIKPQFEAGRSEVSKGGVVRSEEVRLKVIDRIKDIAGKEGFQVRGVVKSPLKGPAGNIEYLMFMEKADEN